MSCNFVQLSIKSICPHHYKGLSFERFYEAITALIRSVEILKRSRKKKWLSIFTTRWMCLISCVLFFERKSGPKTRIEFD